MADLSDQETADIDFTNELLSVTHDLLANGVEKLVEGVSIDNCNACLFSYLIQMQVFVTATYNEVLAGEGAGEWAQVVEDFIRDNPQAFETKIWTERTPH